jgi:hypothetical protein
MLLSWQKEIATIAGPLLQNETRESWLARAARKAGITFRQCKGLFYGEIDDPKVSVAWGVLSAAAKARKEARELASQFEYLAGKMNAKIDQNLGSSESQSLSEEIVALIHAARVLRGVAGTGDSQ